MKNIYTLFFLGVLITFSGIAQTTLILQPGTVNGKDTYVGSCIPCGFNTSNNAFSDHIAVNAWTFQGDSSNARGLVQFDLSTIPVNATILSAALSLYYIPNPSNGDQGQSTLSGSNAAWVQRITSNWDLYTVTWDNQPQTTTQNEALIPESVSDSEDYPNLDVTSLVQDMVNNPSQSFGFMLKLQDESFYRALLFASRNYSDSTKHPKLVVKYYIGPPVASFQVSDSTICTDTCITYTNHSTNATSWLWSFTGADPSSSTDENPQNICYFVPGNYSATLIASNADGSDTLTLTNYVNVYANPPTPVITQSGDTLLCSTNPSYSFYQWYYYSTAIPGATDSSLVVSFRGTYNLKVTSENGCAIAVGINIVIGINKLETDAYFNLYPNPAANQLTLHISSPVNWQKVTVSAINVIGQEISPLTPLLKREQDIVIDISKLAAGIYFLQIKSEIGDVVKKFVKE